MARLWCVGHLNMEDTFYPGRSPVFKAPGGAALYAAAGARLWDAEVSVVSRIGDDYPDEYLDAMQAGGLRIDTIRTLEGPTMAGRTEYDSEGNRVYEMYTPPDRRLLLTPEPEDVDEERLRGTQAVHLATMPPRRQEGWLERLRSLVPLISMDTDVSFVRSDRSHLFGILEFVDIFLPSQVEAELFFPGMGLEAVADRLTRRGPKIVAIKLGQQGTYIRQREREIGFHIPAIQAEVVDVTGAGDAFCGGFVAAYVESGEAITAAWCGAASASVAIEDYGALHLLRSEKAEAELRIQRFKGEYIA